MKKNILLVISLSIIVVLCIVLFYPEETIPESPLETLFSKAVEQKGEEYRRTKEELFSCCEKEELISFLGAKWAMEKTWKEKIIATILLSQIKNPELYKAVEEDMRDSARHWRRGANITIKEPKEDFFSALCEILLKETETDLRGTASGAFRAYNTCEGKLQRPFLIEPLTHILLDDPNEEIRSDLVSFLSWYQDENSEKCLHKALTSDPSPEVRKSVAGILGCRFKLDWDLVLEAFENEGNEKVKERIVESIGGCYSNKGEEKAFEIIFSDEQPTYLRHAALSGLSLRAWLIKKLNTDQDLEKFARILREEKEPNSDFLASWSQLLRKIPGEKARNILIQGIGHEDEQVVYWSACALFERREKEALPALIKLFADPRREQSRTFKNSASAFDFAEHYSQEGINAVEQALKSMPSKRRMQIIEEELKEKYIPVLERLSETDPDMSVREIAKKRLCDLREREESIKKFRQK